MTTPEADTVTPIDLATNTAGSPITVGNDPIGIAITPNGATAYVANDADGTVTPINTATNTAETPITVGAGPYAIAITPNGTTAYVDNLGSGGLGNTVTPINTATNTAGTTFAVNTSSGFTDIAITPNGATAYVTQAITNEIGNTVTPIDLATNTVEPAIAVAGQPFGIAITPNGTTAYVSTTGNDTVTPINTASNTVETRSASVPVPLASPSVEWSPLVQMAARPLPGGRGHPRACSGSARCGRAKNHTNERLGCNFEGAGGSWLPAAGLWLVRPAHPVAPYADHRGVEGNAARRALIGGIAEVEDAAVGGDQPVTHRGRRGRPPCRRPA